MVDGNVRTRMRAEAQFPLAPHRTETDERDPCMTWLTDNKIPVGDAAAWTNLLHPGRLGAAHPSPTQETTMQPTRFCTLPVPDGHTPPMVALTATARGMVGHSLSRAARQAFSELMDAVGRAVPTSTTLPESRPSKRWIYPN